MGLFCRFFGHVWGDWHPFSWAGWLTNGDPQMRFCHVCGKNDYNRDGRVLWAVAMEVRP